MKCIKLIKVLILIFLIFSSPVKSFKIKKDIFKKTAGDAVNKITTISLVIALNPTITNYPCHQIKEMVSAYQIQILKRFNTILTKFKKKTLTGADLIQRFYQEHKQKAFASATNREKKTSFFPSG